MRKAKQDCAAVCVHVFFVEFFFKILDLGSCRKASKGTTRANSKKKINH